MKLIRQLAAVLALALISLSLSAAQSAAAAGIAGEWQGTLVAGQARLRLVLHVAKAEGANYTGTLDSLDQGSTIPIDKVEVSGDSVRLELAAVNGTYEGSMNAERTKITGKWTQGAPLPLEFTRMPASAESPKPADADTAPATPNPFGLPLDLQIPKVPTAFTGRGKTHLGYELHITNFSKTRQTLKKIEVLGDSGTLASFEGSGLSGILFQVAPADSGDKKTIGPGLRAVAFMWVTLDAGAPVPARLRHRITGGGQSVEGGVVAVSSGPVALGPPLKGTNWLAANGPGNASGHRRALIPVEGNAHIAQRFAIDWVRVDKDSTHKGDAKDNKNYSAYGSEVLAVADGVVTATKDGIPENVPGLASRAVPITLETVGGNHIILDLGGGRFGFYAHLQPGSLRVKIGDRVRRGQVIGLLGNSGNSTEPHLHFHLSDANSPLGSEGVPYHLESFDVISGTSPEAHRSELPMQNMRIRFAEK